MAKIIETNEHKAQRMQDLKDMKKRMKDEKKRYKMSKSLQWEYGGYTCWCFVQHYPEYKAQNEFKMQKIKEGKTLKEIDAEYFDNETIKEVDNQENKTVEIEEKTELINENEEIKQNNINNTTTKTHESNNKKQFENERTL